MIKQSLHFLNAFVFLALGGLAVVAFVDAISARNEIHGDGPPPNALQPAPPTRVFALFVDSLRYQSAVEPQLSPYLVSMREHGAYAKMRTVRDAVTSPAIRASFTGRNRVEALGFASNFLDTSRVQESLFSAMKAKSLPFKVYSDEATFRQFSINDEMETPSTPAPTLAEGQLARLKAAVDTHKSGKAALTVFHILFIDQVSHGYAVSTPEYQKMFLTMDAAIKNLDEAIDPGDTLLIFGDHGHDENGRHSTGLEVPTFVLARGPGFRAGTDMGTVDITAVRTLLEHALNLQPTSLATEPAPTGVWHITPFLVVAVMTGLGVFVWATMGNFLAGVSPPASWRNLAICLAGAVAFFAWGVFLADMRGAVHEPRRINISRYWGFSFLLMLVAMRRLHAGTVGLLALGLPFLLFYPTTYRYGAPGILGPGLLCWGVCTAFYASMPNGVWDSAYLKRVVAAAACAVALIVLLNPYYQIDAVNFRFITFLPFFSAIEPTVEMTQVVFGFVSAVIILLRPAFGAPGALLAGLGAAQFTAVFLGYLPAASWINGAVGLVALALAIGAKRMNRPIYSTLLTVGLMSLCYFCLRVDRLQFLSGWSFFAAMRLCIVVSRHLPQSADARRKTAEFLLLAGVIASGWLGFAWDIARIEWHVLYDFFSPRFVETNVGFFLPLILGRFALPMLIARQLTMEEFAKDVDGRTVAFGVGLKALALTAMTLGFGYGFRSASDTFLESVGEMGIWLVLVVGLIGLRPHALLKATWMKSKT